MTAIGLVLFVVGFLAGRVAPYPTSRWYMVLLWAAIVLALLVGAGLMFAGVAVWLWEVMP